MNKITDAHIFLYFQDGVWIAHAQNDMVTQGDTIKKAVDALERLILGQTHLDNKMQICSAPSPWVSVEDDMPDVTEHVLTYDGKDIEKRYLWKQHLSEGIIQWMEIPLPEPSNE